MATALIETGKPRYYIWQRHEKMLIHMTVFHSVVES